MSHELQQQFVRLRQVEQITGLKRSQIYALASRGEFPSPIKLSKRCSGWLISELSGWIDRRIAASRKAG